jgi:hypothetical protein
MRNESRLRIFIPKEHEIRPTKIFRCLVHTRAQQSVSLCAIGLHEQERQDSVPFEHSPHGASKDSSAVLRWLRYNNDSWLPHTPYTKQRCSLSPLHHSLSPSLSLSLSLSPAIVRIWKVLQVAPKVSPVACRRSPGAIDTTGRCGRHGKL